MRNIRSQRSLPGQCQVIIGLYLYVGLVCPGTTPVLPSPVSSLSLQPSGGPRRQMNSLITDDRPHCSVWCRLKRDGVNKSISDPMLQWTNRLTGCTKSTISIRFDVQLKNDFDFDFDDRNISTCLCQPPTRHECVRLYQRLWHQTFD